MTTSTLPKDLSLQARQVYMVKYYVGKSVGRSASSNVYVTFMGYWIEHFGVLYQVAEIEHWFDTDYEFKPLLQPRVELVESISEAMIKGIDSVRLAIQVVYEFAVTIPAARLTIPKRDTPAFVDKPLSDWCSYG